MTLSEARSEAMLSLIAGSTSDKLHQGLDFSPGKSTANHILDREEVTVYPQSGGLFSNQGIRTIRFSLGDASNAFLCGETVRLAFSLRNNGANALAPICATPASLFDRVRLLAGGVEVEDITYHSRFAQQEELFLSAEQRLNNLGETWGAADDASVADLVAVSNPAGEESRVMCSFHIAAFKQPKSWWLAACSLALELELQPDDNYCFAGGGNTWSITKPTLLASVFQVDPAVTSGIASFLNSGRMLSITCPSSTYNLKAAITNSSSLSLPTQRGFSIFACIQFCIFMSRATEKECMTFDHPLDGAAPNSTNDCFGYHVSLGSSRWPTVDTQGVAEQWYRTRMAISVLDWNGGKDISITPQAFRSETAVFVLNLSKVLEDPTIGHPGLSTMNSQNLVLHSKNMPDAATAGGVELPHLLFDSCRYDSIVEIGQEGCREYS
jgi:hypothetical protein